MRRIGIPKIKEVLKILDHTFPEAKCELNHNSPFELLVATILSAQCTDVRVNQITWELFKKYNTPEDFVGLDIKEIEKEIKSCGFYRNKAKSIKGASLMILEKFQGKVPETIEELMTLPGVGKKTANVVASTSFGVPAIAVDTHVFRVANRIGLSDAKNVEDTEEQLMERINKSMWTKAHHLLIFQGRRVCKARTPDCDNCSIEEYCLWRKRNS